MPAALVNIDFVRMGAIAGSVDSVVVTSKLKLVLAVHSAIRSSERDRIGGHRSSPAKWQLCSNCTIQDARLTTTLHRRNQPFVSINRARRRASTN